MLKRRKAVVDLNPPGLPTFTLRAASATFSEIYVDVTNDPAGGDPRGYRVDFQRRNADDTDWEAEYEYEIISPAEDFQIDGFQVSSTRSETLPTEHKYRIRLRAFNRDGVSEWTAYQEITTPASAPLTPVLTVLPLNASVGVYIQPTLADDELPTGFGYEIRRRRNDNTGWGATRAEVRTTNTFFVLTREVGTTAIFNSARYQLRARAYNDSGPSIWSGWVDVTPRAPTAVPNTPQFRAEPGDASIELLFVVPDPTGGSPTAFAYQLRRRNTANTRWSAAQTSVQITTTPQSITVYNASNSIVNGRRHQIRVRAVNPQGFSNWADWLEITPAAG